jgi:hypothetical protein
MAKSRLSCDGTEEAPINTRRPSLAAPQPLRSEACAKKPGNFTLRVGRFYR